MTAYLTTLREFFEKYERRLAPAAFIAGFLWDNLTLRRIDLWVENIVFLVHLTIILSSILVLNAHQAGRLRGRRLENYGGALTLPMQFSFGAVFSGFFVFYSRSASLAASWPFLLFLAFLLAGNELFRKRYQHFTFHTSVFFIALFSYAIFAVPVILGRMGAEVFILSGLTSAAAMAFVALLLSRVVPKRFRESRRAFIVSVTAIYLGFNFLYFTNIIPPIPLSLKEIGVYHSAAKIESGYAVEYEPSPWFVFFRKESRTFHRRDSEPVYVYSAVFAPTRLNTTILHRWSYFNEKTGEWTVADQFPYGISGGRDGGYRGYSLKTGVVPGKWRVDVVTLRGQLVGRIKFEVAEAVSPPELKTAVK